MIRWPAWQVETPRSRLAKHGRLPRGRSQFPSRAIRVVSVSCSFAVKMHDRPCQLKPKKSLPRRKGCRLPVSRILSPPFLGGVGRSFLSTRLAPDAPLARSATNTRDSGGRAALSLLCLAPPGVFTAAPVALGAVGSYPTISTLPDPGGVTSSRAIGGIFSAALSIRSPSGSRPLLSQGGLPYGVRTFLDRSLRPVATARETARK